MKTYALLFAWCAVFLVYAPIGDIGDAPVFWTLLLIGGAVELLGALARHHADLSEAECLRALSSRFHAATTEDEFRQHVTALVLFQERGAA